MLWRSSLFLALVLAIGPHPGAAEGLGSGLVTPIRPPSTGLCLVFSVTAAAHHARSGHPGTAQHATHDTAREAADRDRRNRSRRNVPACTGCRRGTAWHPHRAAAGDRRRRERPARRGHGRGKPWPWTINAEGEPHLFDTKVQAVAWVRQAQARGMRSIDIGCAQVNLMHHPTAFASLEQAFDPAPTPIMPRAFSRSCGTRQRAGTG